jgi:hypothetical protein
MRLIDADALKKKAVRMYGFGNSKYVSNTTINQQPTIDAVKVVRCTECKFQDTCKRVIEIMPRQAQMGYLRGNLHYCEYGERRVDHEN